MPVRPVPVSEWADDDNSSPEIATVPSNAKRTPASSMGDPDPLGLPEMLGGDEYPATASFDVLPGLFR